MTTRIIPLLTTSLLLAAATAAAQMPTPEATPEPMPTPDETLEAVDPAVGAAPNVHGFMTVRYLIDDGKSGAFAAENGYDIQFMRVNIDGKAHPLVKYFVAMELGDIKSGSGTPGFSAQLLKNHFTLYQGYVKNVNALREELASLLAQGKAGTPAYAEQKRRYGWEFNGMRLHELYFGNMKPGGAGLAPDASLAAKIAEDFVSFDEWQQDFKAVGAMRGIGWVILYFDPAAGSLFNVWVNEHDAGHLAGAVPLLILDVFEHAYMLDYGIKKADYIEAFFKAIDWDAVTARFPERTAIRS